MEGKITDAQVSELCMFMRVVELMKRNPKVLERNQEIKQRYEEISNKVDEIIKLLPPEQMDIVLETHRIQLQELEKEAKKMEEE